MEIKTKWGAIYLPEMKQLLDEIEKEFKMGNFVVKVGKAKFNQVDSYQGQEWLNGTGKKVGGIVGITEKVSRWALSFNLRAQIPADTRQVYGLTLDDSLIHKETKRSNNKHDSEAEEKVIQAFKKSGIFSQNETQGVQ